MGDVLVLRCTGIFDWLTWYYSVWWCQKKFFRKFATTSLCIQSLFQTRIIIWNSFLFSFIPKKLRAICYLYRYDNQFLLRSSCNHYYIAHGIPYLWYQGKTWNLLLWMMNWGSFPFWTGIDRDNFCRIHTGRSINHLRYKWSTFHPFGPNLHCKYMVCQTAACNRIHWAFFHKGSMRIKK